MTKKVLVTGANGFIGNHIVKVLLKDKSLLVVPSDRNTNLFKYDRYLKGDILEKSFSDEVNSINPDFIIHLACNISRDKDTATYIRQSDSNIKATLLIAELAKRNNSHIIFPSTVSIYEDTRRILNESCGIAPKTFYGISKRACEQIIGLYKSKSLILRIGVLYGEYQKCNMLIPNVFHRLLRNENVVIFGKRQYRDFLFIDDFCRLIERALNKNLEGIYNVGYGVSYRIVDIVNKISDMLGKRNLVIYSDSKEDEFFNYKIDSRRIRKKVSWVPNITIDEGLSRVFKYERGLI